MKALIFNSGTGSRMGKLTENKPKCLLDINGESILHRQLRLIEECGLKDVIITTGKYGKELEKEFNCELKELSMGMSQDYKVAVKHGSTMLRIGRKLFIYKVR